VDAAAPDAWVLMRLHDVAERLSAGPVAEERTMSKQVVSLGNAFWLRHAVCSA
jgi:hypothetical protein